MTNANDLLFGQSIPGAKFPTPKTKVTGTITKLDSRQRSEYDRDAANFQGLPLWWKEGSKRPVPMTTESAKALDLRPVEDPVLTIQTDERDAAIEGDDGQRRIFISGRELMKSMREAATAAKIKKFEVGGHMEITYTGDGPVAKGAIRGPKEYKVSYRPPTNDQTNTPDEDNPFA